MALKDLSSLFDLVGGNQPVGNMENQQGGQSFDLGPNSILQQNSLPEVPVNSPYQDLDGQPGPQFDLGEDSMLQENSLPNIPVDSEYQDLDGQPGPQFDLGENSVLQEDNLVNLPSELDYPDLNGVEGGNGYFHDIANPGKYQGKKIGKKDLHEHLLTKKYSYTYGNSPENVGPSPGATGNSEYQDLDAVDFANGLFHGINNPGIGQGKQLGGVDLHEALLQNTSYNYSYGTPTQFYNSTGQAGPYQTEPFPLDLNGGLPSTGKYEDNMPQ